MYIVALSRSLNDEQGFLHPNDIIYSVSCKKSLLRFLKDKQEYPITIFEAHKIDIESLIRIEVSDNDN